MGVELFAGQLKHQEVLREQVEHEESHAPFVILL